MSDADKNEHIDLTKLSFEQLAQIKGEFEQEITNMQDSMQTLYSCKAKYAASKEALEQFQPEWKNRPILVPLTSSMYVPGVIKDMDNFVIDVGTGYYIEKDLEGTKDYFKRRVDYVQEQIDKIEKIQIQKNRFMNAIGDVMQLKQTGALKSSS